MYKASSRLEAFIRDAAPPHIAVADAPNTYKALLLHRGTLWMGQPLPVYNGGCDRTIYSSPNVNYAFRAWHDGIHIAHELDFSPAGEQQVLAVSHAHMAQHAKRYGLVAEDFAAITADILGQVMYYQKHGKYVDDQQAFVTRCLEQGILKAIEQEV